MARWHPAYPRSWDYRQLLWPEGKMLLKPPRGLLEPLVIRVIRARIPPERHRNRGRLSVSRVLWHPRPWGAGMGRGDLAVLELSQARRHLGSAQLRKWGAGSDSSSRPLWCTGAPALLGFVD